jgi:hypothetical protein
MVHLQLDQLAVVVEALDLEEDEADVAVPGAADMLDLFRLQIPRSLHLLRRPLLHLHLHPSSVPTRHEDVADNRL